MAVALVGGCHWDLNDPGTDPKPAQFYFPTGIAMDPGRRYLYVANANADLRYGGGTVQIVDALRFECTVARARQTLIGDPRPMPAVCGAAETWDPIVTGARCQPDPLDPSIVDCDETAFFLLRSTVRVGNFAGEIRVLETGKPADRTRRLFVAVRGDPSITFIDVKLPDDPTTGDQPGQVLDCYDDPSSIAARAGTDPINGGIKTPIACDTDHLIQQYECKDLPTCLPGMDNMGGTQLSIEPFGLQLDPTNDRLLVAHQALGQVSVIDHIDGTPELVSTSQPFFTPDATGRHGGFALAARDPQSPSALWYLTSNIDPQIATFRVAQAEVVVVQPQTTFGLATFNAGNDLRDIQFDPTGDRAFITVNNPPSLINLDTRILDMDAGLPANIVTDVVDVCQTPSHMGIRRTFVPGAPGAPTQRKTKIVVVCFLSNQIMIVDPDRPGVDDTVYTGLGGPDQIAFNFPNDSDDPSVDPNADLDPALAGQPLLPKHAYVTNFTESTVALLDLDPGSPTENRVIARMGFPPTGFNP